MYRVILALTFLANLYPALAMEPGEKPPDFVLPANGDRIIRLSQFNGSIVYVDFWASWCAPCRRSLAWLNQLKTKYGSRGLKIITVNLDSDRQAADQFLEYIGSDLTVGYDPLGKTPESFNLKTMPSSFLIGKDGKVLAVHEGFHESTKHDIEKRIEEAL